MSAPLEGRRDNFRVVGGPVAPASLGYTMMMLGSRSGFSMLGPAVWGMGGMGNLGAYGVYQERQQHNGRFPLEVQTKALQMCQEYMTEDQWTAFVDGKTVFLTNKKETHSLMINSGGGFRLLRGDLQNGIEEVSGSVSGRKYPVGDEIAAILAWFRYKTEGLIANWRCGNFKVDMLIDEDAVEELLERPPQGGILENVLQKMRDLLPEKKDDGGENR